MLSKNKSKIIKSLKNNFISFISIFSDKNKHDFGMILSSSSRNH